MVWILLRGVGHLVSHAIAVCLLVSGASLWWHWLYSHVGGFLVGVIAALFVKAPIKPTPPLVGTSQSHSPYLFPARRYLILFEMGRIC
jgi:hypothetical protein